MEFVDTHVHLDFEYDPGKTVEDIVKEAVDRKVTKIITIGSDVKSLRKAFDISNRFENVYHSLGIHPHNATSFNSTVENKIHELNKSKCVAIGEIGLDFYYEHSPRDIQKRVFVKQIDIARELKLPVIIHIREADMEVYEILKSEFKDFCSGVVHCYSGTREQLKKYLDLGMYVSFTGIITFPKADNVRDCAIYAPQERIMIETDAPFLAPVPYRGKKNYPHNVILIAEKIAEIKNQTIEEVAKYTTGNAIKFFSL